MRIFFFIAAGSAVLIALYLTVVGLMHSERDEKNCQMDYDGEWFI
jgi:hypothetical protein